MFYQQGWHYQGYTPQTIKKFTMCFTFTTDEFTQAPHISGSYPDINESILLPSQLIMACFFFAFVLCHADIGDDPLEIPRGNYICIHSGTSTDDAVEHPPTATILGFELWPCSPSARRQAGRSSPKTAGFGSQKKSPLIKCGWQFWQQAGAEGNGQWGESWWAYTNKLM